MVPLLAACAGDTFGPAAGTSAGSGGIGGNVPAGNAGVGASTAGVGGAAGGPASAGASGMGAAGGSGEGGQAGAAPSPGGQAGTAGKSGEAGAAGGAGAGAGAGGGGKGGVAGAGGGTVCPPAPPGPPLPEASCGDGIVQPGETCDDANTSKTDGCAACGFVCPTDWKPARGHCYRLTPGQHRYKDVYDGPASDTEIASLVRAAWPREPCSTLGVSGAHLAMFETLEEADDVGAAFIGVLPGLSSRPWVAAGAPWAKDVSSSDKSVWKNGEGGAVPVALWRTGGPASGERCGVLGLGGTLASVPCFGTSNDEQRQALCESQPACTLRSGNLLVSGFVGSNGHCYAHIEGPGLTHPEAAARCAAFGAHLATFEAPDELAQLPGPNLSSSEVWVGATRQACAQNAFVWMTTGVPVPLGPALWGGSEPNNPNERCATMGRDRRMGDLDCSSLKRPFCERDY